MKNFLKNCKAPLIILILIVLLGSFLRLYKLGEKSFVADEFLGVNATYGFSQTEKWKRWDFNWGRVLEDKAYARSYFDFDIWGDGPDTYIRAWVYNWQVAQTLNFLSPQKESSYRLVGSLWGIISILFVFFVAKKMTGKTKIALLAAFFMAVSLSSVEISRKVRMYTMFSPIFLLFSYYLFNLLESKRKAKIRFIEKLNSNTGINVTFFLPVIFFGLLSAHLHLLALNIIFIVVVYWLIMAIIVYIKTRKAISKYSMYLAGGAFLVLVVSIFSRESLSSVGVFLGFVSHFSYLSIIFSDYSSWALAFILILIGNFFLVRNKEKEGIFLSVFFWSIALFAIFLWKKNVGDRFIFFIKPFQVILLASGVYAVALFLSDNLKKCSKKASLAFIVLMMLIVPNFNGFFGDDGPYIQTSRSSEPNYKKTFAYFMKKRRSEEVLVTRNFRNFYLWDARVKVFSMGGERAEGDERVVTLTDIKKIVSENPCGWMIFSDNDQDFITKEAQGYIVSDLEKVDNSSVRGPISVIRWCYK